MPARRSLPRFALVAMVGYGVPVLLALLMRKEWPSLLVPAAGPWAGRLFGHSCGIADHAPGLTLGLVVAGVCALGIALLGRRRWLARVPLALWWVAWVLAALGCVVNTTE